MFIRVVGGVNGVAMAAAAKHCLFEVGDDSTAAGGTLIFQWLCVSVDLSRFTEADRFVEPTVYCTRRSVSLN